MRDLQNRAYAAIELRAMDDDRRTFKGVATTPAVDRVGDVIDPMGVKFRNPLSLLYQHIRMMPIGTATFSRPTKKGIEFEAHIPNIDEPLSLKERVDTAWAEVKHNLIRAVSVGFKPLKYAFRDDGGVDYQEIEVFELSIVTIPAHQDALISAVKSMEPISAALAKELKAASQRGIPLISARDGSLRSGAVALKGY